MSLLIRVILTLIFCLPSWAYCLACSSTASGDWNAAGTWTSCGGSYPQAGDTATINAHTVTIPAGTFSVGTGTGASLQTINSASSILKWSNGARLNLQGYMVNKGTFDMTDGGGHLHFLMTTGNCPVITGNDYMGQAKIRIGSSAASPRSTISNDGCNNYFDQTTLSGYPQDYIIYNLDWDASVGQAGNHLFDMTLSSGEGVTNRFYMEGSRIKAKWSIMNSATAMVGAAEFTLKNNFLEHTTTAAGYYVVKMNFYNAKTTGVRLIQGNTLNGRIFIQENRGLVFDDNSYVWTHTEDPLFTNSQDFAMESFSGNVVKIYNAGNMNLDATLVEGNIFWSSQSAKVNPHSINTPTRNIGTTTLNANIWSFDTGTDNNGDSILVATPGSGPVTLNITNNLILPNASNGAFGTLVSALGNANVTLNVNHNTVAVGCTVAGGDNAAGVVVGETYAGFAGQIASGKSNLFWCNNSGATAYKFQDVSGTVANLALAASLDYNTGYNIAAASAMGYTGFNGSPAFGANDIDEDPNFVDRTRNMLTFYALISGDGTPTYTELEAELRKKNDPNASYNTAYDGMYDWIRAGFVPQNENLRDAGHDGVTIGAMEMAAPGAGGGHKNLLMTGVG